MRRSNATRPSALDHLPRLLLLTTVALSGSIGCAHHRASTIAASVTPAPRIAEWAHAVPAVAPDTFPSSLFFELGVVRRDSASAYSMIRSIVKVLFKLGAPQRERQQAIDRIGGVVVGGFRITDDGDYYVLIAGRTYVDIQAAIRTLDALPQVEGAFPFFLGNTACCG